MEELYTFAAILMNHVRNSDRTSMDDVVLAYDRWDNKRQETLQANQQREQEYHTRHEEPRNERVAVYAQYLQSKQADFLAIPPSSQRMQELRQWIARHGVPEALKNGIHTDLIYTSSR